MIIRFLLFIFLLFAISIAKSETKVCVSRYKDGKSAAISYTFDDGLLEHYTVVYPLFTKNGLKATFFINGSSICFENPSKPYDTEGRSENYKEMERMTWDMLREMSQAGHEISSHGWGHRKLTTLEGESLRYEVQHNDTMIWEYTGAFPRTFCFPNNSKNEEKEAFAMKDRVACRITQTSIGSHRTPEWLQIWPHSLIKEGSWGIGMTHGISKGYDHFADPQTFIDHITYVASLKDSLWIDTFHDIACYVTERDSTTIDVQEEGDTITILPHCSLNNTLFNVPLTLEVGAKVIEASQGGRSLMVKTNQSGISLVDFLPCGGKITAVVLPINKTSL